MRASWIVMVVLAFGLSAGAQEGPKQDEYRLVVGDTIEVTVVGHPDYSLQNFQVPAGGRIRYPQIGYIELVGKRVVDLAEEIEKKFEEQEILIKPQVIVAVISYAPRRVYLTGSIYAAIDLPVHEPMRLLQVIAQAGGWGNGDKRNVRIIRKDGKGDLYPIPVNAAKILDDEDWDKNLKIMPDDLIYIPPFAPLAEQKFVYVLGYVNRPGPQPLLRGRGDRTTLAQLVSIVGGFSQYARTGDIRIIRKTGGRPTLIHIDFDDIIDGERDDVMLEADDIIYVPESVF